MPVERESGWLPMWVADPHAADFADPPLLAWEQAEDSFGPGGASYTAWSRAHGRLLYALDLAYGKDQFPGDLIKPPRVSGAARPSGGPPEDLHAAVIAWQAEEDARIRAVIRHKSPHDEEGMLARFHVPPPVLPRT